MTMGLQRKAQNSFCELSIAFHFFAEGKIVSELFRVNLLEGQSRKWLTIYTAPTSKYKHLHVQRGILKKKCVISKSFTLNCSIKNKMLYFP